MKKIGWLGLLLLGATAQADDYAPRVVNTQGVQTSLRVTDAALIQTLKGFVGGGAVVLRSSNQADGVQVLDGFTVNPPQAAPDTAGVDVTITAGEGGDSTGIGPGGTGGSLFILGPPGGAGFGVKAGGFGSTVTILAGRGGPGTATGVSGGGGSLILDAHDAGANGGGGAAGAGVVSLGGTYASEVQIGHLGMTTAFTGSLSLGGTLYTGTFGNLNTLTNGSDASLLHSHTTVTAPDGGAGEAGSPLVFTTGGGGAATVAAPGEAGGSFLFTAGAGGDGLGGQQGGKGGTYYFYGGTGGAGTASVAAQNGGDFVIQGGLAGTNNGGGAGVPGTVYIGGTNTYDVQVGSPTTQTTIMGDISVSAGDIIMGGVTITQGLMSNTNQALASISINVTSGALNSLTGGGDIGSTYHTHSQYVEAALAANGTLLGNTGSGIDGLTDTEVRTFLGVPETHQAWAEAPLYVYLDGVNDTATWGPTLWDGTAGRSYMPITITADGNGIAVCQPLKVTSTATGWTSSDAVTLDYLVSGATAEILVFDSNDGGTPCYDTTDSGSYTSTTWATISLTVANLTAAGCTTLTAGGKVSVCGYCSGNNTQYCRFSDVTSNFTL